MTKPIIFLLVIISRIAFLWFSGDARLFVHPVTSQSVSFEAFVWQIGNFVPVIALGFMSIFRDNKWMLTSKAFIILSILDYIDWILEGNHVWWTTGIFPVSMNTLFGFVFAVTFMYEFMKYGESGKVNM